MPKRRNQRSDPRRTDKLTLIELHYENFADELKWTADRYRRLCSALQLTVWELGALVRCAPSHTDQYLRAQRFPRPVELHLTLIEHSILPTSKPPIIPNIH